MSKPTPMPRRLPNEPPIWYRRFCAWCRMPLPRSVLGVSNQEREKRGKKTQDSPPGTWAGKPSLYQWKERAADWDLAEAERLNCDLSAARDEWRAAERETARLLLAKGQDGLKIPLLTAQLKDGGKINGDPQAVRVAILALTEASNLARRALEMATTTSRLNVGSLADDELIRLYSLAEQASVGARNTAPTAEPADGGEDPAA